MPPVEPPDYIKERQQTERERRERHKHDANLQAIHSIADTLGDIKQQTQGDDDGRASRERITIKLLIGTLISAVAAAAFTGLLWKKTSQLVESGDLTAQRQLRAYVYATPGRAFHVDGKIGALQVYTFIGNSGQTFAKNVRRYAGIDVLPPTPDPASIERIEQEDGVALLNPKGQMPIIKNWSRGNGHPSEEEYDKIRTGELRVYVFGKILYDDEFGNLWETDFCNSYFGSEGIMFPVDSSLSFGYEAWQAKPCENGNNEKKREKNERLSQPP